MMGIRMATRSAWTVSVEQDSIDTTCSHETLDPNWKGTDSEGHEHYYDKGYPTLRYVVDSSHWCDGHEGLYNHDPHEAIDEDHYECLLCGEVVEPGTLPPYYPQSIPGPRTMTLKGVLSDGRKVVAQVAGDGEQENLWRRLTMTSTPAIRDRICEQWVEEHPEWIVSVERIQ